MTLTDLPLLDRLLADHADALGDDAIAYGNHCHRMLHYCFALTETDAEAREKLQIAAAFHDLAIWTHGTIDYLRPSAALARAHLDQCGRSAWAGEVDRMIDLHHRLRPLRAPEHRLVEAFRKADLVDVSLGLVRFGLPGRLISKVKASWPNAGFHRRLLQLSGQQLRREPLRPLPMLKW